MTKVGSGAGHGGNDPGAVAYGRQEAVIARQICNAFNAQMSARGHQIIFSTIEKGYPYNINEAVSICNVNGVTYAIQHHLNAGGGTGVEVLYYNNAIAGRELATKLSQQIANTFGFANRGAKSRTNLGFLNNTNMTAVIIEWGFMDSPGDADIPKILANINGGASAAASVFGGITPDAASYDYGVPFNSYGWKYKAHIQNRGDSTKECHDGIMSGSKGGALRYEAFTMDTTKLSVPGILRLGAVLHRANVGWEDYGEITPEKLIGKKSQSRGIEYIGLYVIENTTGKTPMQKIHSANVGDSAWKEITTKQALAAVMGQGSTGLGRSIEAAGWYLK